MRAEMPLGKRRSDVTQPTVFAYEFPGPYEAGESRQYQLLKQMAANRRVYFISTIGRSTRSPFPRFSTTRTSGDVVLITRRTPRGFDHLARTIPVLARMLNVTGFLWFLRRHRIRSAVVATTDFTNLWSAPLLGIRWGIDFIDPPFLGTFADMRAAVRSAAPHVSFLTATASSLLEVAVEAGVTSAVHVPNACSGESLRLAESTDRTETEHPVALYVGTIDWRFDLPLLGELAGSLPDFRFEIAGRINGSLAPATEELAARHSNLRFLGAVSEEDKATLLAGAVAGLVPFLRNEVGDAINPTKVYEYAAWGLPVVASATRACVELAPIVTVGRSSDELVVQLREMQHRPRPDPAAVEFARANTWADRALVFNELVDRAVTEQRSQRGAIG